MFVLSIYITLPPHEILPFIENLDDAYKLRNSDFCFFSGGQYGNIEEILQQKGLCRDTMTQILIAGLDIAGNRIGDVSVNLGPDSYGEDKIAGECASCGKWKGSIAPRLERVGKYGVLPIFTEIGDGSSGKGTASMQFLI